MNAEILAVGSELLTAGRLDTNSLWLTDQLNDLGVEVVRKGVIGDDRERLTGGVREALARVEILLITGGLGPTEDDLTRDAVAAATGRALRFDEAICAGIEARFQRFGRTMSEVNKRQAYVIEGAAVLPNSNGTAPGQWLAADGKLAVLLPGPPNELKPMFTREVLPRLREMVPPLAIAKRWFRVAGMPESDLDQLIAPVYTRYTNPVTTILASAGDIEIHLRARCATFAEADGLCAELAEKILALLGDRVYSFDGSTLDATVGRLLTERGETVAVAESATGGTLAQRLTRAAGSSRYFVGGFLTYTDGIKTKLLGIPAEVIAEHTAVSEAVAAAMAANAREKTGATWALSITGEAGPEPATGAPVGTMYVGLAGPSGTEVRLLRFGGDRERVRGFVTNAALNFLRHRMLGLG
ncbi:MAG TPA: competence/damage-inducible protein A [Solibacterales bacterium]|nr:competence/damage-inducible protein A [Bryobacterales bacterium]